MSDSPFADDIPDDAGLSEQLGFDEPMGSPEPSGGSWFEKLFDGDALGPTVAELEADYDLPKEVSVMLRGILRVASGSGVPPIAEIALGAFMYLTKQRQGGSNEDIPAGLEGL